MKKLIICIGSGRCGTLSFSKLMGLQKNVRSLHEPLDPLPWNTNPEAIKKHIERLKFPSSRKTYCFTAFFYLNYLDYFPRTTKVIALKRNKEETIQSFIRKNNNKKFSQLNNKWRMAFPNLKSTSIEDCYSQYYDIYYKKVNNLEIPIFKTEDLNSEEKTLQLIRSLGIKEPKYERLHINVSSGTTSI